MCKDVQKGDVISEDNVKSVRPSYGLHPKYLPEIMGKNLIKKSVLVQEWFKFIEKLINGIILKDFLIKDKAYIRSYMRGYQYLKSRIIWVF